MTIPESRDRAFDLEFLTRADIARILRISPRQASRLIQEMPTVRVTKHIRVAREDFEAWLRNRRQPPADGSPDPIRTPPKRKAEFRAKALLPLKKEGSLIEAARRMAEAKEPKARRVDIHF